MGMISLSLFLAIIIENLHHRRPKLKPVPKWLKSLLFGKLTKFLGIKLPKVNHLSSQSDYNKNS